MRTDLDIGARNPVTTTVTGFLISFFEMRLGRYHTPKTTFGGGLELNTKAKLSEKLQFL